MHVPVNIIDGRSHGCPPWNGDDSSPPSPLLPSQGVGGRQGRSGGTIPARQPPIRRRRRNGHNKSIGAVGRSQYLERAQEPRAVLCRVTAIKTEMMRLKNKIGDYSIISLSAVQALLAILFMHFMNVGGLFSSSHKCHCDICIPSNEIGDLAAYTCSLARSLIVPSVVSLR